jgi:PAS domain S-box-containing protein
MRTFLTNMRGNASYEKYLDAVVSSIRVAVLDSECRIIWASDRFCSLLRHDKEELIGLSIDQLSLLRGGDRLRMDLSEILIRDSKWSGELKVKGRQDLIFWVQADILPILDEYQSVDAYIVNIANITAKKGAQEEMASAIERLKQSEARYRALVENQPDMISLCNVNGTRVYVNASFCQFVGKSYDEVVGTSVLEDNLLRLPRSILKRAFRLTPEMPEISVIYELENVENERFWISGRARGIFDSDGKLFEILTIGRDVTGLKEAELQKTSYIQDLERIAFMTSHNVRGPIASMLGLIELLRINGFESDQWGMLDRFKKCVLDLDFYTREMGEFIYDRQTQ